MTIDYPTPGNKDMLLNPPCPLTIALGLTIAMAITTKMNLIHPLNSPASLQVKNQH